MVRMIISYILINLVVCHGKLTRKESKFNIVFQFFPMATFIAEPMNIYQLLGKISMPTFIQEPMSIRDLRARNVCFPNSKIRSFLRS